MVVLQTDVVKVLEDLLGRAVLLDLAGGVEADHVARLDLVRQLERFLEPVLLNRLLALVRERDDKVDRGVGVVLLIVL